MHKIFWVCAGLMECNAMQLCKEESQLNRISDNIRMAYPKSHTYFFLLLPLKASSSGREYRRHGLPYLPIGNDVKAAHCSCHHIHWFNFSSLESHQPSSTLSPKAGFSSYNFLLSSFLSTWMANTGRRILTSSFPYNFLSSLIFIVLTTQPCSLYAQSEDLPIPSPTSSISSPTTSTLVNDPADNDNNPTFFNPSSPPSAVPSAIDSAGYGGHDDTTTSSSPHSVILNYYFLLLAVLVIAMLIVYWTLSRRRRRAAAQLSSMQQRVLSEDVRNWTRHRQAGYGFEDEERGRPAGRVEGLNETGEAPPAYVKEPERVHLEAGEGVELRGMTRSEGKPPDYEERPPPR